MITLGDIIILESLLCWSQFHHAVIVSVDYERRRIKGFVAFLTVIRGDTIRAVHQIYILSFKRCVRNRRAVPVMSARHGTMASLLITVLTLYARHTA
jgi:hypothetical protein